MEIPTGKSDRNAEIENATLEPHLNQQAEDTGTTAFDKAEPHTTESDSEIIEQFHSDVRAWLAFVDDDHPDTKAKVEPNFSRAPNLDDYNPSGAAVSTTFHGGNGVDGPGESGPYEQDLPMMTQHHPYQIAEVGDFENTEGSDSGDDEFVPVDPGPTAKLVNFEETETSDGGRYQLVPLRLSPSIEGVVEWATAANHELQVVPYSSATPSNSETESQTPTEDLGKAALMDASSMAVNNNKKCDGAEQVEYPDSPTHLEEVIVPNVDGGIPAQGSHQDILDRFGTHQSVKLNASAGSASRNQLHTMQGIVSPQSPRVDSTERHRAFVVRPRHASELMRLSLCEAEKSTHVTVSVLHPPPSIVVPFVFLLILLGFELYWTISKMMAA